MTNYRRYRPYRQGYRSGQRPWTVVGWVVVGLVALILVRNAIGGKSNNNQNINDGITLASNANGNVNGNANVNASSTPEISGRELSTKDCAKGISQGVTDKAYVALTLDGGGIVGDAQKVLDVLKEKEVPATLFVTGKWVEDNAEVVKAYAESNIEVFNHSYGHQSFIGTSAEKIDADLTKAESAILDVTGKSTKPYFRPPLGDVDEASLKEMRKQGYCAILWTVDAMDWKEGITVDEAKSRVLERLKKGAIIMLQANSDIAAALVGPLVDEIRGQGYTLVSLRDLLRQSGTAGTLSNNSNTNTD